MSTKNDMPSGVRAFNFLALYLFQKLYDSFPERVDINGLRAVVDLSVETCSSDEAEIGRYLAETLDWLEEEGFIRVRSKDLGGNYHGVGLTLRGLTAIGYVDTVLPAQEKKEPLIDKIRRVLAKGAHEAASDTVRAIMTKALELMIRQV